MLGSFDYDYEGVTERLSLVKYPNGQTTKLSYFEADGDRRLKEILHRKPDGSLLSRHGYTYNPDGNIRTWLQETDVDGARQWEYEYDGAQQLTSALQKSTGSAPSVLKRYFYRYDAAGNRTSEQINNSISTASHNGINQLTGMTPGGKLRIVGRTDEPATVTVQGQPVRPLDGTRFEGEAEVAPGTSDVEIKATDLSGNVRTYIYRVNSSGSAKTLTYDANGNVLSDGVRSFEWDALDQLTAVNQGTHRSEFGYDGEGHRVRIVEKESGTVTEDRRFLWCGTNVCEERDAAGSTAKRYVSGGLQQAGGNYFVAGDHLGSLREMTDGAGAVRARYDYDPYGTRTNLGGDLNSDAGYTGHFMHGPSGLALAMYRAYDSRLGR